VTFVTKIGSVAFDFAERSFPRRERTSAAEAGIGGETYGTAEQLAEKWDVSHTLSSGELFFRV